MSKSLQALQEIEDELNALVITLGRNEDNPHVVASRIFITVAREMDALILQFNPIKGRMDEAHKANDADAFDKAHIELKELLYAVNFSDMTARVNRRRKWLRVVTPLRNALRNKFAFVKSARDNGAKARKRMRMSDKQRKAADNTSARMRMMWG